MWMLVALAGSSCTEPLVVLETEDTSDGSSDDGSPPASTDDWGGLTSEETGADDTSGEPVCGNGLLEASEACDDGAASATCDEDCTPAECGDGLLNELAGEQCDEGGATQTCNPDCTRTECGNGIIEAEAEEECDGTNLAGATCQDLGMIDGTLACSRCSYDTSGCIPGAPVLSLGSSPIKRFDFSWPAVAGAEHYQLLESASQGAPFVQLGADMVGESISLEMPLYLRWQASYVLRACNDAGCTDSAVVNVVGSLADAVGYFKASNTGLSGIDSYAQFAHDVALSADGNTLAVGADWEDSGATGIDGNQDDGSEVAAGAVYVFTRDGVGEWSQQAYVKASNTDGGDHFGTSVALSSDGNTLVVGAVGEASAATGIGGNQTDDSMDGAGAVYVFARDAMGAWSQAAYVKASNPGEQDQLGESIALSADGNTMVVGAPGEDSNATGIGGDQANESMSTAGAVYVFARDGVGTWSQQAYVKASNTGAGDVFGHDVALSSDATTLAVGALSEDSNATGIGGNQANESTSNAGAVYVFMRDGMGAWSQQAYVKASNPDVGDWFGWNVALSGDGNTLAASAGWEDGTATGIDGDQTDDSTPNAGAVYVFERDAMGAWSQAAYVKASNPGVDDFFGYGVALGGDGTTLAVGAYGEGSDATGIGGDEAQDGSELWGAVYVFERDGVGAWSQQAYVKASNADPDDFFGRQVALSEDGRTLAVGAEGEDSSATGVGGNQADEGGTWSGAVYLF